MLDRQGPLAALRLTSGIGLPLSFNPTVTAAGGGSFHPTRSYGASWRSAAYEQKEGLRTSTRRCGHLCRCSSKGTEILVVTEAPARPPIATVSVTLGLGAARLHGSRQSRRCGDPSCACRHFARRHGLRPVAVSLALRCGVIPHGQRGLAELSLGRLLADHSLGDLGDQDLRRGVEEPLSAHEVG